MSLQSTAQELIVLEPVHAPQMSAELPLTPLEVVDMNHSEPASHEPLEVNEPLEVEIVVGDLPGAPSGTPDPEAELEVSEDDSSEKKPDENDAKSKKPEKWDWSAKGASGFVTWIQERLGDIPKHSGYDTAGLERAISYLDKLDNEISKAMRLDLDGELDANKVEEVRSKIDEGVSRLQDRIDKVRSSKKPKKKKRAEMDPSLIKEAQKITGVQGVFVTVSLLTSRIARVCINGMISAGHDIEDIYAKQVKKYKLSEREQAEVRQLLEDMGYALRQDRGFFPDDDVDPASSDNIDWQANYKG